MCMNAAHIPVEVQSYFKSSLSESKNSRGYIGGRVLQNFRSFLLKIHKEPFFSYFVSKERFWGLWRYITMTTVFEDTRTPAVWSPTVRVEVNLKLKSCYFTLIISHYLNRIERRELKTKQTQFKFLYSSTQATAPGKHPLQNCSTLATSNQHPWWLVVQTFNTWLVIGCSKFETWTSNI